MENTTPQASHTQTPENGDAAQAATRNLTEFLRDLIDLVCAIRSNLQETSQHMPQVAKQLGSVSAATETAVVEILNVLEALTASITDARTALAALSADEQKKESYLHRLEEEMPELVDSALWNEFVGMFVGAVAFSRIDAALQQTDKASVEIALALQVQDVTSQQISGATHSIEKVERLLLDALHFYEAVAEGKGVDPDPAHEPLNDPSAFNGGAIYTNSTDRQEEADRITRQFTAR